MLKKTLIRAGIGFLIGMVVGNVIAILTGSSATNGITFASVKLLEMANGSAAVAMLLQSLFSGLYGALCFAGISFYEIERWPLALATFAHCAVIIITFIPVALLLGWVGSLIEILIIAGIQLIAFFIIWLSLYFGYKKQVRELNDMQKKFSQKAKETESQKDPENDQKNSMD